MFTAEVSFPLLGVDREQAVEAVHGLLSVWYKNGQIVVDPWPMTIDDGSLRAVVLLPDASALRRELSNRYAEADLASLPQKGVGEPTVVIRGFDPASLPACDCPDRMSFILFTHYVTFEPPLCCGDCFNPVPLYRLPTGESGEHLDILHWRADYKACDTLQMHCTVGERFAEQQLYRHDSALSKRGRELSREIAARTGKPTYYYLHKSRGRSTAAERRRRCPSCRGEWLLEERYLDIFQFRCDRCYLLSDLACGLSR